MVRERPFAFEASGTVGGIAGAGARWTVTLERYVTKSHDCDAHTLSRDLSTRWGSLGVPPQSFVILSLAYLP
jgi:hypothetical protein